MKRRLLLVALCAVLAIFTGACSSPDSPKAKPTASASKHEAPQMPDSAREFTEEGAEAFFRYFLETSNHSLDSGDLEPMRRAIEVDCEGCATLSEYVSDVYDAGGYVSGNHWVLNRFTAEITESGAYVTAYVTTEPGEVSFGAGEPTEIIRARTKPRPLYVELIYANGYWTVAQFATEKA